MYRLRNVRVDCSNDFKECEKMHIRNSDNSTEKKQLRQTAKESTGFNNDYF